MKKSTALTINACVFIVFGIVLMLLAYFEWSEHGDYTFISFLASLLSHGGFAALFGILSANIICRYYDYKDSK